MKRKRKKELISKLQVPESIGIKRKGQVKQRSCPVVGFFSPAVISRVKFPKRVGGL